MPIYIALLRKDPDSDFGVDFPDFPGCITAAGTIDEIPALAAEALRFHMEGMAEDGEPIPPPRPLAAVRADPRNRDALPFLVEVEVPGAREGEPRAAE